MAATFKGTRFVFLGKQRVAIESFDLRSPEKEFVLVKTDRSLMSTGTENIVFNRLFDPGTHWDAWVQYPFYPGYASVGTIEQIGSAVSDLRVGDRVAFRHPHASHALVAAANCYRIPDELPFSQAVWFALAKIAFQGARAAQYSLGDTVMVIGGGPIGQMSIRWASAAGAGSICVVDTVPGRLQMALAGGATKTILESIEEAREVVLENPETVRPHIVIDTTGNAKVLSEALGLVADYGRVVILGDTGQPAHQTLTSDVITRGLSIVGAHDAHNVPPWTEAAIVRLFFDLAVDGRFALEGLNTHCFPALQCAEAYALVNRERAATMGILFDWNATSN